MSLTIRFLKVEPGGARIVQGEIVAVVSIDMYKACRNCNALDTGTIATCTNNYHRRQGWQRAQIKLQGSMCWKE